jgi:hypothetical protein
MFELQRPSNPRYVKTFVFSEPQFRFSPYVLQALKSGEIRKAAGQSSSRVHVIRSPRLTRSASTDVACSASRARSSLSGTAPSCTATCWATSIGNRKPQSIVSRGSGRPSGSTGPPSTVTPTGCAATHNAPSARQPAARPPRIVRPAVLPAPATAATSPPRLSSAIRTTDGACITAARSTGDARRNSALSDPGCRQPSRHVRKIVDAPCCSARRPTPSAAAPACPRRAARDAPGGESGLRAAPRGLCAAPRQGAHTPSSWAGRPAARARRRARAEPRAGLTRARARDPQQQAGGGGAGVPAVPGLPRA